MPSTLCAVGDQHGVLARDHHQVLDPEQAHQRLVGGGIGAARVDEHRRALRGIAGGVLVGEVPDRLPGADIRPAIADTGTTAARVVFSITA